MAKRKKGMSVERHKEIAAKLLVMSRVLSTLYMECYDAFRQSSKQVSRLRKTEKSLNELRSVMEDAMFNEHPELPNSATQIYYRLTEEKQTLAMTSINNMLST